MAYITPQIPWDVSPGAFQHVRFYSLPIFQWRKVEVSVLVEKILWAPEWTEWLDEAREIAARKSKEAIIAVMNMKNTISPTEKVLRIREHLEFMLICRHFIFPATLFRIKDFIEKDIDPQAAEFLRDILQQQEEFQDVVLQYGHLSIVTERWNTIKPISDLIQVFQKLPTNKQPIRLIESLQNPETHEKTRRQIQSYYKALKNKR